MDREIYYSDGESDDEVIDIRAQPRRAQDQQDHEEARRRRDAGDPRPGTPIHNHRLVVGHRAHQHPARRRVFRAVGDGRARQRRQRRRVAPRVSHRESTLLHTSLGSLELYLYLRLTLDTLYYHDVTVSELVSGRLLVVQLVLILVTVNSARLEHTKRTQVRVPPSRYE